MKNEEKFNKHFWAFIYLINLYPNRYLNKYGKIIYKIVLEEGHCRTISKMAKYLKMYAHNTSKLCRTLKNERHIMMLTSGNKKIICFDDSIIEEGIKIINNIVKKEEE